ncbi:nitrite reductase/ring-hydroxylating ferredoxin subunit [Krasilnikovia cinnamomea]|uniref:Nitrite reductase/ring-hydroxylating ferredoxin subunit n=1 Tax=Krasilnikovia cinnamomea TaxID=349313 RepID=A0A4Q7ZT29_9ACTN|nr:Rieske 2Fe-2S domain-containing protein [Krasilnikovia cinnamomea]RZU54024.1 nitrite reductase/ring-hydroxylating ferredoxin subunit [Krasilnikovia cinnamomea]
MQTLTRLQEARSLDPVSDKLQAAVTKVVRPQRLRDLLQGIWLGHPLHPALVQVPIGAFLSAAVLDLMPGRRRAATTLIAVGTGSVAPAVAAGLLDWSQMTPDRRRVGLVHAAANTVAVGLYAASLVARLNGRDGRGRLLGFAGLSAAGLGAFLGGHLSFAQGAGTNQAVPELARVPADWTAVGSLASLPDRKPTVRTVGDVPVLLYRTGDRVCALIERCGHETGPLGEGDIVGEGPDACVVCPWHGSTFRLADGAVVHGPAASDQPTLPTRVRDGMVELRQP